MDCTEDDFVDGGASKASRDDLLSTGSSDPPPTEGENNDDGDGDGPDPVRLQA